MGVRRYQDLITWQLADAFEREVSRLVAASARAAADRRFSDQLLHAAASVPANISEGFLRKSPGDFRRFLDYALGSIAETESRIRAGTGRGYFSDSQAAPALLLARRTLTAAIRLKQSQYPPRGGPGRR